MSTVYRLCTPLAMEAMSRLDSTVAWAAPMNGGSVRLSVNSWYLQSGGETGVRACVSMATPV